MITLQTMMSGKHFDTRFVEIKKHNKNIVTNVSYNLMQQTNRVTCALLVDVKTIIVKDLDNHTSFMAFGCDKVIGKKILEWSYMYKNDQVDILTFENYAFYARN